MTYIHRYYQRCHGHGYQHVEICGLLQYQHMHQSSSVRCLFAGKQYHEMSPVPSTFHASPSLSAKNNNKKGCKNQILNESYKINVVGQNEWHLHIGMYIDSQSSLSPSLNYS